MTQMIHLPLLFHPHKREYRLYSWCIYRFGNRSWLDHLWFDWIFAFSVSNVHESASIRMKSTQTTYETWQWGRKCSHCIWQCNPLRCRHTNQDIAHRCVLHIGRNIARRWCCRCFGRRLLPQHLQMNCHTCESVFWCDTDRNNLCRLG